MSRSYRGAISAAVGLVAAGLISIGSWQLLEPREPDIPAYKGLQAQNTHYRPGGSRCNPARLEAVKGEASDERDRCEEAEEQHRLQSDDLVQQTRAANAAEATSRLTYGQSRVMAFQTIAGLFTLFAAIFAAWYARRAAQEGSRGSDAAEDALAHARTTSVMELRPYLHVEQMGFVEQSNVLDEPNLILKIKNYGQTPANNFSISAGSGRRGKTSASPNIRLRECPVSDEIPPGGRGHHRHTRTRTARKIAGWRPAFSRPIFSSNSSCGTRTSLGALTGGSRPIFSGRPPITLLSNPWVPLP